MWIIQSYKQHFCNVYFQAETEVTVTNSNAEVMDKLIVSGYDVKVRASGNGRHLKNLKMRDKCMVVSPLKPYCHTNKSQMYGSQSTQALLPYK